MPDPERKRATKAERLVAKREEALAEATRLAGLLGAAPGESDDPMAPPAFVTDPRLAPALIVWRELQPQLAKSGRLHRVDRFMFAALCYWRAEWIAAVDDILANGYSFMGRAVAGGSRPWANPSVERRDTAWSEMTALSAKFGLTPLDRIAINRGLRDGHLDDADLFPPKPPEQKPDGASAGAAPDTWGGLLDEPATPRLN